MTSLTTGSSSCCCFNWVSRRSLTFQIISVAFYIEGGKSDKFYSEALISAWGSFTCCKSTTRDQRLYFPSEGSLTQEFQVLKKIHRSRPGLNPRTSDPVVSMITTGVDCLIEYPLLFWNTKYSTVQYYYTFSISRWEMGEISVDLEKNIFFIYCISLIYRL